MEFLPNGLSFVEIVKAVTLTVACFYKEVAEAGFWRPSERWSQQRAYLLGSEAFR